MTVELRETADYGFNGGSCRAYCRACGTGSTAHFGKPDDPDTPKHVWAKAMADGFREVKVPACKNNFWICMPCRLAIGRAQ